MRQRDILPAVGLLAAAGALALGTSMAAAQEPQELIDDLARAIDTGWLLIAAVLVLFMQAGFAFVEAGFIRSKNVVNILMKNILDVSLGAIAYWAVGFAIAYGAAEASSGFIGAGNFFLNDFDDYPTWIFQFAFAATAATIVSGAMAERTKFHAYLIYTVVINRPDLPGGDALGVGRLRLADRLHRRSDRRQRLRRLCGLDRRPLGGRMGGAGGRDHGGSASRQVQRRRLGQRHPRPLDAAGHARRDDSLGRLVRLQPRSTLGLTGGLVAITAATATVDPWAAVIIGVVAGAVIIFGVELLDRLRIDDPVGAVLVHLFNGIWGTLAVGLFTSQAFMLDAYGVETSSYGPLLGGGVNMLLVQALGIVAVGAWVMVLSVLLFGAIRAVTGLRVSAEEEESGLDVGEHRMEAYPEFTGARDPFGLHAGTPLPGASVEAGDE